ncbi:MAG: hypothetical protein ABI863_02950 [Ginsengibacter sp.]
MILKILISSALILVVSCRNPQQKSKENISSTDTSSLNCYVYIKHLDTVILKTTNVNGSVTGTLVYNFYQKDKYMGTIQGQMNGELLLADFSFFSEGVKSVRQVAFKKHGKSFIEGYGDTEDINGKTAFKNTDSLSFKNSIVLREADCKK